MSAYKQSIDLNEDAFRVQLSQEQLHYLVSILPSGYSFQLQPKTKKKQTHSFSQSKKKVTKEPESQKKQQSNSLNALNQSQQKQIKKAPPKTPIHNQKIVVNQSKVSLSKWAETAQQPHKKCAKMLKELKNCKFSWPFQQPVNVEELQIPQYLEIIKEPMDLTTIEEKLRNKKYHEFSLFQADVLKIIQNSYRFNEANEEFLKITADFESFFHRITAQPQTQTGKNVPKNNKKKKKSTQANRDAIDSGPVTLLQKKQLAQQIRRLGKEHIKAISSIVFDSMEEQQDRFDLERLSHKKLRQLQRFIRGKIIANEEKVRATQKQKNETTDLDLLESQESSHFIIEEDYM